MIIGSLRGGCYTIIGMRVDVSDKCGISKKPILCDVRCTSSCKVRATNVIVALLLPTPWYLRSSPYAGHAQLGGAEKERERRGGGGNDVLCGRFRGCAEGPREKG
jgi:hypothetical protein